MNYRHSYHAGNACDVVKHVQLTAVLDAFYQKEKPFAVLDTHAGTGLYYLESSEAAKTYEYEQGIKQLWSRPLQSDILKSYIKVVTAFNSDGILKYYPGSPLIIDRFLRETDHLICSELHPEDGKNLKNTLKHQQQVSVHLQDGYLTPKALLPFAQKRGIVFIDPPFEKDNEFDSMIQATQDGLKKMPQVTFMLWYPIKDPELLPKFYEDLRALGIQDAIKSELYFYSTLEKDKLNGSGMVILNPPWGLEAPLKSALSELSSILAFEKDVKLNISPL